MLGSLTPATRVTTGSGADVTALLDGSTVGSTYVGRPAEVLYLEFPTARSRAGSSGRIIVVESFKKEIEAITTPEPITGRLPDARLLRETGVKLEYEDETGAWRSVAHRYPREHLDALAFVVPVASRYRLVLVGRHRLAFVGCSDAAVPAPENARTLLSAHHSRLGDVTEALLQRDGTTIELQRGEQVELHFQASDPRPGDARELFLASTGVYTSDPRRVESSPTRVVLSQNQPNPFSKQTEITLTLPTASHARLEVFDLQGRSVAVLANGTYPAGTHSLHWNGFDSAKGRVRPGVYLYRLRTLGTEIQKRMVVLP
jgi:hypothetical protein